MASQNPDFAPVKGKQNVSKEDKTALRELLVNWRKDRHFRMGNSPYIPCEVLLPPKQLEKLVTSAGTFLKHPLVEPKHIQKAVPWDMAPDSDVAEVCGLLHRGRVRDAAARYPGPLLPRSRAPGVVHEREGLEGWMRQSVMSAGDQDALWAWLQTTSGATDLPAWQRLLVNLPFADPRRSLAASRIAQLRADGESAAGSAPGV